MNQRVVRSGGAKLKNHRCRCRRCGRVPSGARAVPPVVPAAHLARPRTARAPPPRPAARAARVSENDRLRARAQATLLAKQGSKQPAALRGRRCPTARDASSTRYDAIEPVAPARNGRSAGATPPRARPRHHLVCAVLPGRSRLPIPLPRSRQRAAHDQRDGAAPPPHALYVSALASDFTDTYLYVNPTQPQEAAEIQIDFFTTYELTGNGIQGDVIYVQLPKFTIGGGGKSRGPTCREAN